MISFKKDNYCIIMAGGVGARFWPYSTKETPKQFLDFMGTGRSMLQMTFDRLDGIVDAANVYIVTNAMYKDLIMEQLPMLSEEQVLLEPMRRNTAPCIAYAVYKIRNQCDDANILVIPSDHLILNEREYRRVVVEGLEFVGNNSSILTLGMKPTRPETGYGYIQLGDGENNLHKVKTFTEKPNREMAQLFLDSGEFYWNSGMFLWNMKTIEAAFEEFLPEIAEKFASGAPFYGTEEEQMFIDNVYPLCQNISIDYGVMERAQNVYVMLADFGWSDVGTWSSLYDIQSKDDNGNVVIHCEALVTERSKDNLIVLPKGQNVVIDGLEGFLVAQSNDVLLICRKDEEARLRQLVGEAEDRFKGTSNNSPNK